MRQTEAMASKVNVLLASNFGSLKGGGQRSVRLLLKHLDRRNFNPLLMCSKDGDLVKDARELGLETDIIPSPSFKTLDFGSVARAFGLYNDFIKRHNINLIHTDCPRLVFYLGPLARRLNIPLVFHARVSSPEPIVLEWLIGIFSSKIVVVSKGARKRFERLPQFMKKVTVVYNAVDTQVFSPDAPIDNFRKIVGGSAKILIGIIGQIIPLKGQKDFIMAAAEVLKERQGHQLKFIVMGQDEGGYQQSLVELTRLLAIENDVVFLPFQEEIQKVMAALDILVNASELEGFSRVIIEAMACGKPVIATNVGGNPEAVEHGVTGFLVPAHDPQSMASAMKELIDNPSQRRQMGIAAREKVFKLFSIDRTVKQIEEIYAGYSKNP